MLGRLAKAVAIGPSPCSASLTQDRQIELDDPGEQTQGQTQREASAPADAGDCLSHSESGAERIVSKRLGSRLPGLSGDMKN